MNLSDQQIHALQGQFVVTYDFDSEGSNYTHYLDFAALIEGEVARRRTRPELRIKRIDRTPPDSAPPEEVDPQWLEKYVNDTIAHQAK